ncbi:hypothetical protein FE257_012756 [Aspergillus nanangensis]|uniref:Uncharacterized protein n=1 Tax=Aspergillus nanangensis TaxID=2582783 RepID=A0AAD4GQJ3_ASPNN|nr:hypothetical protein FE257_012756 [Aspergillus nanangensis]
MGSNLLPERIYIFTYPRTGSNLLTQLLALDDQPNVASNDEGTRFFLPWHMLKTKWTSVQALSNGQRTEHEKCIKECFGGLLQHLDNAEREGKIVCFKDHAHYVIEPVAESRLLCGENGTATEAPWTLRGPNHLEQSTDGHSALNETFFPDEFLTTWKPVFLIKHPAAAFPSFYRALAGGATFDEPDQGWRFYEKAMTLRWVYNLYHFYVQNSQTSGQLSSDKPGPIVLEADDIIKQPEILGKFCQITGLDHSKLRFKWEKTRPDESARVQAFRNTLYESTGIDPSRAVGDVDLGKESGKWREEFGVEIGERIERYVRKEMPYYEFLRSKRLQL